MLLAPVVASASFYDHWGFSPRAVARGGAMASDSTDFTAVYYNPAMLVLRKDLNFGFAFNYTRSDTWVAPKDDTPALDCIYCDPVDWAGSDVGLLFPLGGKVKNHLAIGLGLHLPSARLVSIRGPDPNRPFWYMWHNDPDRLLVHLAAGIRLLDQLTIGGGTQVLADLVGSGATVNVDLFARDVKFREIDSHLATSFGPVAGIYFEPIPALRFGVSWRGEMRLVYRVPANIQLEGIGELNLRVDGVNHYSPHAITGSVSWDPLPKLTLSLDANYQVWSRAPSPYVRITVDISGETLEALGLSDVMDMDTGPEDPGFKDTVTTRLGAEYRVTERFSARTGAWYRPTPVPNQTQPRTNIMDSNTFGVAGGIGFAFDDPLEVFQAPIIFDLAVQGIWLLARDTDKAETDEVPSYSHSARIFGATAAFRYNF